MHNSIWRLLLREARLTALLSLIISLCIFRGDLTHGQAPPSDENIPPQAPSIYDSDPNHIWNRLFVAFYRQKFAGISFTNLGQITGPEWVGPDVLDPPIGYHPKFLLEDEPFGKCDAVLDEFLNRNGAGLIRDPLKRAFLQRDLWAVFDVLARAGQFTPLPLPFGEPSSRYLQDYTGVLEQHRITLERKLALVIHKLALSRDEIEKLPDTYNAALHSGAFSDALATNRYNYLPQGLFAANSGWHEILPGSRKQRPILQHTLVVGGRSVFRAFIRLPPGADYKTILDSAVTNMVRNAGRPCFGFPRGTQFLLLREMISLDQNEQMVATHVVESVQFRSIAEEAIFDREAALNRALLFQGRQGGLRPIPKGEMRARGYSTLGALHDDENGNGPSGRRFPGNCAECHSFVNNQNALLSDAAAFLTPVRSASIEAIAQWKEDIGRLDLLRKFIASPGSDGK